MLLVARPCAVALAVDRPLRALPALPRPPARRAALAVCAARPRNAGGGGGASAKDPFEPPQQPLRATPESPPPGADLTPESIKPYASPADGARALLPFPLSAPPPVAPRPPPPPLVALPLPPPAACGLFDHA